jgi:putative transposase
MPRHPRFVFPDIPHHITQRGNYRQNVFRDEADYQQYSIWLAHYSRQYELEIWAYCFMSNHIHLIAVPRRPDSMARALSATHMRYAQLFNRKLLRSGHLWQGRFFSCALDEDYLFQAACYVELNPVRAGLVAKATDWPWSSAIAHAGRGTDELLTGAHWPPDDVLAGWEEILDQGEDSKIIDTIRKQTYSGRPLGSERFISELEKLAGCRLRPLPHGRPKKSLSTREENFTLG